MILALKLIAYFLFFLLGFSYNEADKGQIEAAIKYADINRYGLSCDFNIDEALKYYKKVHDHSEDARKSIFALEIKKKIPDPFLELTKKSAFLAISLLLIVIIF